MRINQILRINPFLLLLAHFVSILGLFSVFPACQSNNSKIEQQQKFIKSKNRTGNLLKSVARIVQNYSQSLLPVPPIQNLRIDLIQDIENFTESSYQGSNTPHSLYASQKDGKTLIGVLSGQNVLFFVLSPSGEISKQKVISFPPMTTEVHLCNLDFILKDEIYEIKGLFLKRENGKRLFPFLLNLRLGEGSFFFKKLPLPEDWSPGFSGEQSCKAHFDGKFAWWLLGGEREGDLRILLHSLNEQTLEDFKILAPSHTSDQALSWSSTLLKLDKTQTDILWGAELRDTKNSSKLHLWMTSRVGNTLNIVNIAVPEDVSSFKGVVSSMNGDAGLFFINNRETSSAGVGNLFWWPLSGKTQNMGEISTLAFDGVNTSLSLDSGSWLMVTPPQPSSLPLSLAALISPQNPDRLIAFQEKIKDAQILLRSKREAFLIMIGLHVQKERWPEAMRAYLEIQWISISK